MVCKNLRFLGNPTLETSRLILRKLTLEDANDVYEYARIPEVAKYVSWENHNSLSDAIGFIKWALDRYEKDI